MKKVRIIAFLLIIVIMVTMLSSIANASAFSYSLPYAVGSASIDGPIPLGDILAFGIIAFAVAWDTGTALGNMIKDWTRNPNGWVMVKRTEVPSTQIKDGKSIEEEWLNTKTGQRMWKHDVKSPNGKSIKGHPHWRSYSNTNGD